MRLTHYPNVALVQTLTRLPWSLSRKRKGCVCRPSYRKSGHSWHTFQDLEGRRNGYEQLSQDYTAVAFGAGRRSHGPCLCLTPAREGKMEVDCPREQSQRCQATLCSLHHWEETRRKAPRPTPTLKSRWTHKELAALSSASNFILTTHKAALKKRTRFIKILFLY